MSDGAEKRLDYPAGFAMFEAEAAGAGNTDRLLRNPQMEPAMNPNDTAYAVAGHESSLAHNMGVNSQEINALAPRSRLPWLRAARALEAAAQRRRMERRAGHA